MELSCNLRLYAFIPHRNSSVYCKEHSSQSFVTVLKFPPFFNFQSYSYIEVTIALTLILYTCYAFGIVFMICESGQQISNFFGEIDDVIAQTNWYLFSDEMKLLLPTIIINSQQPVVLQCIGTMTCNREAFKQVRSSENNSIQSISNSYSFSKCILGCYHQLFLFHGVAQIQLIIYRIAL